MGNYNQIIQSINNLARNLKKKEENIFKNNNAGYSISDELIKLKSLLDNSIITDEEFRIQKEKILKID